MKSALPIVGIMTGDPNGIGPEVTVKAWASGSIKSHCRPLIVGSRDVVEQAVRATALGLAVRSASDPRDTDSDPGVIDVLESAPYAGTLGTTEATSPLAALQPARGSNISMGLRARARSMHV